jgi:hypothetical protein
MVNDGRWLKKPGFELYCTSMVEDVGCANRFLSR